MGPPKSPETLCGPKDTSSQQSVVSSRGVPQYATVFRSVAICPGVIVSALGMLLTFPLCRCSLLEQ